MEEILIGTSVHVMSSSQGLRTLVPLFVLFSTHLLASALSVGGEMKNFSLQGVFHILGIHELMPYMSSEIK